MNHSRELMRTTEAAEWLAVSTSTFRRWVREGRIRTVKLPGGGVRIRKRDIDALVKALEEGGIDV